MDNYLFFFFFLLSYFLLVERAQASITKAYGGHRLLKLLFSEDVFLWWGLVIGFPGLQHWGLWF